MLQFSSELAQLRAVRYTTVEIITGHYGGCGEVSRRLRRTACSYLRALFPGLIVGLLLAKKICRRQILQPGKCYKWVRSSD
ncbi:hypothetical protein HanXRQr2_Chr15g0696161 [Helianthus annuus]|uniref:Uncharacterized protein n=1 Tax=Helianthus annuus TaxID=4232 RepID=A0A9K3E0X1_HELAN|nr:hypothetical protein HanXRQr2_Chr15g0696161 [Helianthus annuus]KAJ0831522.1 hypothetical protein HanPSC8_Chr15g0668001 [Helianthus annuus]